MRFVLPASVLADLRAMQARRGYADDITEREDAFLLDPGLGPACYLTADGRMLRDYREWVEACGPRPEWEPPVREATADEAVSMLVVGAKKTGVAGLIGLLPPRPPVAAACPRCLGERWWSLGADEATGQPKCIVCPSCGGRGWVEPSAVSSAPDAEPGAAADGGA
jgi:hypothetical protein